jgi:PAS domain S-box-containing protein
LLGAGRRALSGTIAQCPLAARPNASTPRQRRRCSRAHHADDATWDKAALAAALDPVITIDAFGIIHSASNSVQRVLGWTPAELQGKNVSILMPEPHRSGHDGYLANYHRTGQTNILNRPRRFDAQRKDGSLVPIELCVSRADIPATSAPMFVGIIRDMSDVADAERSREQERVQYQQLLADQTTALQSAHLRLRMADRMASIGTLAAGLGHDMNNVLLPVRARLNALKAVVQAGRLSDAEGKHVEEIAKSVAYLQQLADGLHFLALDPEAKDNVRGGGATTDLKNWWSHVGSLLSKAVPKHVQVQASIPDNLPRFALPTHQLTQAMLNLVVNAGEAIPPPSQRKRRQGVVRLRAQTRAGRIGPARAPRRHRQRLGHDARSPPARLRDLLHHQAARPGHRVSASRSSAPSSIRPVARSTSSPRSARALPSSSSSR